MPEKTARPAPPITKRLPTYILEKIRESVTKEIDRDRKDLESVREFKLEEISFENQLRVANILRGAFDPEAPPQLKGWGLPIASVDLGPGKASINLWVKSPADLSKEKGAILQYEIHRW